MLLVSSVAREVVVKTHFISCTDAFKAYQFSVITVQEFAKPDKFSKIFIFFESWGFKHLFKKLYSTRMQLCNCAFLRACNPANIQLVQIK